MYRNEINQLKVAVEAIDALIEGTGNVYSSMESIRFNNEPIKSAIDYLLFSRQNLISQIKVLEIAQLEAQLALTTEQ